MPARPALAASPAEARAAWRAWTLAWRPDLAVREGVRWPRRARPLDEAGLDSARASLARVRATIAAAPRGGDGSLDSLAARGEREWAAFERDAWRREPAAYAATTLEAALDAAAAGAKVSPCERSRRALAPLRATPEALRAARVNLRDARAGRDFDAAATLARWDRAIARARAELTATALACKEGSRVADLVEADSLAIAAAERFRGFVRDELVQSARPR